MRVRKGYSQVIFIGALALQLSACSTIISNSSHGYNGDGVEVVNVGVGIPYSGTKQNFEIFSCNLSWLQGTEESPPHAIPLSIYSLIDLPFSFIADTLFLPFDLSYDEKSFKKQHYCHLNK